MPVATPGTEEYARLTMTAADPPEILPPIAGAQSVTVPVPFPPFVPPGDPSLTASSDQINGSGGGGDTTPVVAIRAWVNTFTAPPNTNTIVPLANVSFEQGGAVLNADGTITVPVSGFYQVTTNIGVNVPANTAGGTFILAFAVNGTSPTTQVRGAFPTLTATQLYSPQISDLLFLNAGDQIRVQVLFNTTVTIPPVTQLYNYLALALVGASVAPTVLKGE